MVRTQALNGCTETVWTGQESELFQHRHLFCYTRHRVKSEEKMIPQHQTTSLYIQFVHYHWIIPSAFMYHLNPLPSSNKPPTESIINSTTTHHPMSEHLKRLPYPNNASCHHSTKFPHCPTVSQLLSDFITSGSSIPPYWFQCTIWTYHSSPGLWEYPPPRFEVLRAHFPSVLPDWDITDETPVLPVTYRWGCLVPMIWNHTLSFL